MAKQTFTTGQVLTAAQMTSLQQTAMGGGSTTAKTASYVLVAADAGTVVQMNAAGATTITVNTALFAAGDSVQIQNVGAGVCTVTAGTATVSTAGSLALSQYEGGQLYFNTTSAALFFDIVQSSGMTNPMTTTGDIIYSSSGSTPARLGIGTTGQVLNVASGLPAWTTASSGAVTQISTSTLSSAAADFTFSSISGSYNHLMLIIAGISAGSYNGLSLKVQLNSDTAGNYAYSRNTKYAGSGTAITIDGATAQTSMDMGTIWAGVAQAGNVGAVQMLFPSYKETTLYKNMIFSGGTWSDAPGAGQGWARWGNTAAITTIKIFSTQNFATGTTATLYGMS